MAWSQEEGADKAGQASYELKGSEFWRCQHREPRPVSKVKDSSENWGKPEQTQKAEDAPAGKITVQNDPEGRHALQQVKLGQNHHMGAGTTREGFKEARGRGEAVVARGQDWQVLSRALWV